MTSEDSGPLLRSLHGLGKKAAPWTITFCAGIAAGALFCLIPVHSAGGAVKDGAGGGAPAGHAWLAGPGPARLPGADGGPAHSLPLRIVQTAQAASLEFIIQNVAGRAGAALPLDIKLPKNAATSDYALLMFRGLPEGVRLSAGFRTKESWAVSLRDAPGLTLIAPAGFQGAFLLEVLLIKGRDTPPESRKIAVDIQRDGAVPAARQPSAATGSQILTAAPPAGKSGGQSGGALTPEPDAARKPEPARSKPFAGGESGAEEAGLLTQANELLNNGDISRARMLFEHLAMRGSAKAALAAGQTYDPNFLSAMYVKGLKPDAEKAKHWYRKAAELGHAEAQSRLSALSRQ